MTCVRGKKGAEWLAPRGGAGGARLSLLGLSLVLAQLATRVSAFNSDSDFSKHCELFANGVPAYPYGEYLGVRYLGSSSPPAYNSRRPTVTQEQRDAGLTCGEEYSSKWSDIINRPQRLSAPYDATTDATLSAVELLAKMPVNGTCEARPTYRGVSPHDADCAARAPAAHPLPTEHEAFLHCQVNGHSNTQTSALPLRPPPHFFFFLCVT